MMLAESSTPKAALWRYLKGLSLPSSRAYLAKLNWLVELGKMQACSVRPFVRGEPTVGVVHEVAGGEGPEVGADDDEGEVLHPSGTRGVQMRDFHHQLLVEGSFSSHSELFIFLLSLLQIWIPPPAIL